MQGIMSKRGWPVEREHENLIAEFLSAGKEGSRYLLGRNEHSRALAQVVEVDGFIDDFSCPGEFWEGKRVVHGDEVPSDAIVVNCSTSISPISAHHRVAELPVKGVLSYADLLWAAPERVPIPDFIAQTERDLAENQSQWRQMSEWLADDLSRKVLNDVLRYRLSGDYRVMADYSVRFDEQYFEPFLHLGEGEIFVDAGGFDGDTTEEFCRRYPDYGKVYLFEPSQEMIERAKSRLAGYRGIEFIAKGLSDVAAELAFDDKSGSASSIIEEGASRIGVTTLDDEVADKVTFIKMDIEGWEIPALAGCKKHIMEDHPVLAISVYHKASDFWRIPKYVFALRKDYDLYLRHYTEGWSETVMFFVPEARI